ncbi:uncharacterized protein LOC119443762 [Dermacentor silvarum]|uniref:uncharacterized protein LOC119443762 n=1 Tax=Dermacentor silvarum TaxID=543639 RepID=UPI002100ADFC|nr:uncharacterized protein LOC119443762 [Dermacentor silvarum]
MLFKYDFRIGGHLVKSSYIRQAYEKDRTHEIRSIPRLNDRHFNLTFASKMSVKLAAQVFSNHCAAAMYTLVTFQQLPAEAIHTARFVERIDRLFDCLNSSQRAAKTPYASAMCNGSVHREFLTECIAVFENMRVVGCPRQPPCIRGFCLTMRSLLMLYDHLTMNYGFSYVLARRLNQDALENSFSTIRSKSGANTNTTAGQFQAAFRHLLINNLFKLSENSNCAEDMTTVLATLPVGISAPFPALGIGSTVSLSMTDDSFSDELSDIQQNNLVYFAGWLAAKFLRSHSCVRTTQKCSLKVEYASFSEANQVLLYLSVKGTAESDFGSLSVPSPPFVSFVEGCENVFQEAIGSLFSMERVGHTLCTRLHEKVEKALTVCEEDVYNALFCLFARIRLHWFARKRNVEFQCAQTKRQAKQQVQRLNS